MDPLHKISERIFNAMKGIIYHYCFIDYNNVEVLSVKIDEGNIFKKNYYCIRNWI